MSTRVFPTLIGLGWDVERDSMFNNDIQTAYSGKESRTQYWPSPKHNYQLVFNFLRQGTIGLDSFTEFADLYAFFNLSSGNFDTWLYNDVDDNSVTTQLIGEGDGATLTYQLVRSLGGYSEPILAPHAVATVYVDGVDQVGHWSVSNWGTSSPGIITFGAGHAPAAGKLVTATFTYYWPCRFVDPNLNFNKFMNQLFEAKAVKFMTVFN